MMLTSTATKAPTLFRDRYLSWEVCRETGVTARQLQWWDERGILKPEIRGHKRLYTREELERVRRLAALRKAGASLQDIRKLKLDQLPWTTVRASRKPILIGDTLVVPL